MERDSMTKKLNDLAEVEQATRQIRESIVEELVNGKMVEFFSINWRKLYRSYGMTERKR